MANLHIKDDIFAKVNSTFESLNFDVDITFYQGLLVGLTAIKMDRDSQQFSEIIKVIINDGNNLNGNQFAEITSFLNIIEKEFNDKGSPNLFIPKKSDKPDDLPEGNFNFEVYDCFSNVCAGILYGLSFSNSKAEYFPDFKKELEEFRNIEAEESVDWQALTEVIDFIKDNLAHIYKNKKITFDPKASFKSLAK